MLWVWVVELCIEAHPPRSFLMRFRSSTSPGRVGYAGNEAQKTLSRFLLPSQRALSRATLGTTTQARSPRAPPVRSIPAEVAPFVDAGRRNHAREGRYRRQPFRQQPQSAASYYAEHVGSAPEMAVAVPPSKGAPNLTTMFSRSDSASFPVGASSSSEGVRGPPESALPRNFSGPLFPPGCVLRKSLCGQW